LWLRPSVCRYKLLQICAALLTLQRPLQILRFAARTDDQVYFPSYCFLFYCCLFWYFLFQSRRHLSLLYSFFRDNQRFMLHCSQTRSGLLLFHSLQSAHASWAAPRPEPTIDCTSGANPKSAILVCASPDFGTFLTADLAGPNARHTLLTRNNRYPLPLSLLYPSYLMKP